MSGPEELARARKSRKPKGTAAPSAMDAAVPEMPGAAVVQAAATGITPVVPAEAATDALFRDTIIAAAAEIGFDGDGLDGLKGYLRKIAGQDRKTYFGVLAKFIAPDTGSEARDPITKIERVIVRAKE
jgi:hypothetical protein